MRKSRFTEAQIAMALRQGEAKQRMNRWVARARRAEEPRFDDGGGNAERHDRGVQ